MTELAKRKIVTDFPRKVREIENTWIVLSDGTRLAARIWLPEDAEKNPVPVIFEYLPYRKRDGTNWRDEVSFPYLAGHGYACVRVDMRGNGESDGVMLGEYLKQEQDDALEAIDWITKQPWSTGKVGMWGISWGGFNSLQVAARRPEALKAIITLCSTDDRYADDIHYKGGCLLNENLGWSSTMFCYSSRPPDPLLVGNSWHETWMARLKSEPLLLQEWLEHQTRDDFWRHGSICEDWSSIQCAVFAVGGWSDAYSNAVPRLLENLQCPRLGLIGPWLHKYPHFAVPTPNIGFLQEALRFWDHWLKGATTGIMDEPMLRAYIQDWAPPKPVYPHRDGRFVGEKTWPSPRIKQQAWHLGASGLSEVPQASADLIVASPTDCGTAGGEYCQIWLGAEGPWDQRADDGGSLCLDSAPLLQRLEILGAPVAELEISVDRPVAHLIARLCDVAPDGSSLRVTFGVLNLTHRDSHAEPLALEPGKRYRIRLQLDDIGQAIPAGHRLRLALSTHYWPMIWPAPELARVTLHTGESRFLLPLRPVEAEAPVTFQPAESAPEPATETLRPANNYRRITKDVGEGVTQVEIFDDFGDVKLLPHGLSGGMTAKEIWRVNEGDPTSASGETWWSMTRRRGNFETRTETWTKLTCDRTHFQVEGRLEAYEGDHLVLARDFLSRHRRRLV